MVRYLWHKLRHRLGTHLPSVIQVATLAAKCFGNVALFITKKHKRHVGM